ncbi:hypothetical protein [Legionella maioricensis]|uniref:Uncharacterized protein n=1 Tax=Legionella maioricensis TaxID=2896528 RepID=A0A9X2D2Z6_9GAMM|nr:hypothetical protein [Legionella maioricensis]MCL9684732.1 hypothetical protein [Legionella maioricensis]MCL9687760.1 hypothetical protein [Legionella maioricensis]
MNVLSLMALLIGISMTGHAATNSCEKPKLIKPIENWDIIAYNVAVIKTAPYFSGSKLTYTMTYKKIKSKNKVAINNKTGELKIDAETKDNFDLKISAKNSCGSVASSFNVLIDEEE